MNSVHQQGRRDPHEVLGVSRGADRQQVIQAFHRRARRGGHPDTGGDAQTFEEIVHARDALLDRARLDADAADRRESQPTVSPHANPRRADSHPRETMRETMRPARPTGQGGSLVPLLLFVLCVFALPVLFRILSLVFIP